MHGLYNPCKPGRLRTREGRKDGKPVTHGGQIDQLVTVFSFSSIVLVVAMLGGLPW